MAELSVILGLNVASGLLVVLLGRWLVQDAPLGNEARTLVAAMRGAVTAFRTQQTRRALLPLVVVMAAAASCTLLNPTHADATLELCLGLVVGGILALGCGRLATALGGRACRTTAALLSGSATAPFLSSLRGAAAAALGLEVAVSMLTVTALAWAYTNGASDGSSGVHAARVVLAGMALGSVATGAVVQASGAAVASAAEAGAHQLDPSAPVRLRLEPQNPALVTSAVGPELGRLSIYAHEYVALSLLCNVAALVGPAHNSEFPFAVLAVCLLIRAAGLVASGIALLSVRVDDGDDPVTVLFRAQLAAAVMSALCISGACRWLLGEANWSLAATLAMLGLFGQVLVAFVSRSWLQRRAATVRWVRDAAVAGSAAAASTGVGLGVAFAGAALLVPMVAVAAALAVAAEQELGSGALGAFALCLAGFVTTLPLSRSLGAADPVIESGCGIASLEAHVGGPQGQARLSMLDFVAAALRSIGDGHTTGVWVVVGTGLSLLSLGGLAPELETTLAACGSILGAAFVLSVVALSSLHAARTFTSCGLEVRRQLRSDSGERGPASDAAQDRSPSYRDTLKSSLDVALSGIALPTALLLSLPLALGALGGRWLDGSELRGVVSWFLGTALCAGLTLGGGSAAWAVLVSAARRHSRAPNASLQLALNDADQLTTATGQQLAFASRLALAGATATGFVLVAIVG